MPTLIKREDALHQISQYISNGECLVCHLLKNKPKYTFHSGTHCSAWLTEYPRTWGQTMIVLNKHKTSFSEIEPDEWQEMTSLIKKLSVAIESTLKPVRCYVAALGSEENLPNTCPHIHFNIIPVYDAEHKPKEIFTWEHGVYSGTKEEWDKLFYEISEALQ